MKKLITAALIAAGCIGAAAPALAQVCATYYKSSGTHGEIFSGSSMDFVPGFGRNITRLEIPPGCQLYTYDQPRFVGNVAVFSTSGPLPEEWKNKIQSLSCECSGGGAGVRLH